MSKQISKRLCNIIASFETPLTEPKLENNLFDKS